MASWMYIVLVLVILHGHKTQSADIEYMKSSITDYFSDTRHHAVNPEYKAQAKKFIHDEFRRFGLDTEYHNFHYFGSNFSNIIGIRKGKNFGTQSDKIIGVCAHYDTVANTKGVDDNGSGVSAMLEVARQLSQMKVESKHTIMFLSPDLEENGLAGSKKFFTDWFLPWSTTHYGTASNLLKPYGVIVLDTVMEFNTSTDSQTVPSDQLQFVFPKTFSSLASENYKGNFIALIYRSISDAELAQSFTGAWMQESQKKFKIENFSLPVESPDDSNWYHFSQFYRSDHYNFWTADVPAIFLTDTADFRGDMIQCYHNPCDNLEVMLTDENVAFLGKTADAVVSTISELSGVTSGGTDICINLSLIAVLFVLVLKI